MPLMPFGKGIMGVTLHFPYEVRDTEVYFEDIPTLKLPKEAVELATGIIEAKTVSFDPVSFVDHYEEALVALIQQKKAGHTPLPAPSNTMTPPQFAVNIMDFSEGLQLNKKRYNKNQKKLRFLKREKLRNSRLTVS